MAFAGASGVSVVAQAAVGEVVDQGVDEHVEVVGGDLRVAPLFVFSDCERERGIEHGVEDVDERDLADDGAKKIGTHGS